MSGGGGQGLHAAASSGDVARARSILTTPRSSSAFPLLSRGWGSGNKGASGGADVNELDAAGCTPLQRAAADGHEEIVRLLLAHGADVNRKDAVHGNTALHEAAWKGYSRTVGLLAAAGAQLGPANNGGFAPLHLCCQNGHNQSCREILLAGCDPDLQNNYGDTPLHTSARYGHAGVTRILISALCRVSDQNKNGDTALHIASAMGRRKLTRILVEAGCDKHLRNKQGETAKDIATRKDLNEIINIINTTKPLKKKATEKLDKKRPKTDSPNSKDSAKHKDKKKSKVRFENTGKQWSPYGCHYYPDPKSFPKPNLDSLPVEPLRKGEQYYLDLAGNICKGPVGVGYTCYCAPFFKHMEERLDRDKQELKAHIDKAHEKLDHKVTNLELKTQGQISELTRCVAAERALCDKRHQHLEQWLLRSRFGRQSERVKKVEYSPLGSQEALPMTRSKSLELLDDATSNAVENIIEHYSKKNSRSMELLDSNDNIDISRHLKNEASCSNAKLTYSKNSSRVLEKSHRDLSNSSDANTSASIGMLSENYNFKSQVLRETANARGLFKHNSGIPKSNMHVVKVDHHADNEDEPRKTVSEIVAELQRHNENQAREMTALRSPETSSPALELSKNENSIYNNSLVNNTTELYIPINVATPSNYDLSYLQQKGSSAHNGDQSESSDDEDEPVRTMMNSMAFPNYENLTSMQNRPPNGPNASNTTGNASYSNAGMVPQRNHVNGNEMNTYFHTLDPTQTNMVTSYGARTRNGVYSPTNENLPEQEDKGVPEFYMLDKNADSHIHVHPLENYRELHNTGLYVLGSHENLTMKPGYDLTGTQHFVFNNEPILQVNTMLESDLNLPQPHRVDKNRRHVDLQLLERDVHNRIANLHVLDRDIKKDVALLEHNDSGYSTKVYGSSQGNSPSLSGQLEVENSNSNNKNTSARPNNVGASSLV